MTNKIVIEDWYLQKEYQAASVWNHEKDGYIIDDKEVQTSYRLVGTKEQITKWARKQGFILDEVYRYSPIKKDSYWDGICCHDKRLSGLPTRAEYNKKWRKDFKEYSELYKENKNKLLIL